jgi:TM2 domain-containing membrane protein YozV
MRKLTVVLVICTVLLAPVITHAQNDYAKSRKDPILAGALSWYVPGLGQMYSGAFLKGAAFFVVEEALLIGTVLSFAELNLDVSGSFNIGLSIKSKDDPDRGEQRTGILLGVSLIIVHFVNVIDAVNTSRRHNRTLDMQLYTDFDYDAESEAYRFEINQHF